MNHSFYLTPNTKTNLRQLTDLTVKTKLQKLLEDDTGKYLYSLEVYRTMKVIIIKEKVRVKQKEKPLKNMCNILFIRRTSMKWFTKKGRKCIDKPRTERKRL